MITRPIRLLIVLATAATCASGCTSATPATNTAAQPSSPPPDTARLQENYVSVVRTVLPSVVQITTTEGLGSGIVFDQNGDIVTNAHVVGKATTFQVQLANSTTPVPATLVGAYAPDDLAVIHLDRLPQPAPVPGHFGDSSTLEIGDIVLAMGNPLGLTGSVTNGIVSATGRTVSEPAEAAGAPAATLADVIQTSAAINPGNSGGALVDLAGDIVGIPTLAGIDPQIGGQGTGSAAPGIGFAIPANIATDIAGQLVAGHGHVANTHRAALGVEVSTVLDQSGQPRGAVIRHLTPGGPAANAGAQTGDTITAVGDTPIHTTTDLTKALARLAPGQSVPVTIAGRSATPATVMVTLGQLPGS